VTTELGEFSLQKTAGFDLAEKLLAQLNAERIQHTDPSLRPDKGSRDYAQDDNPFLILDEGKN
jgi:hypothetical protein